MMKKITLIRHAQASFDSNRDFDRNLTIEGERQAIQLKHDLERLWVEDQPDLFGFSSSKRTRQTMNIIGESQFYKIFKNENSLLYESSLADYLDVFNNLPKALVHVVIIGHNPTITLLGQYLSGTETPFQTATCIEYQSTIDQWHMVCKNIFTIEHLLNPKMF